MYYTSVLKLAIQDTIASLLTFAGFSSVLVHTLMNALLFANSYVCSLLGFHSLVRLPLLVSFNALVWP